MISLNAGGADLSVEEAFMREVYTSCTLSVRRERRKNRSKQPSLNLTDFKKQVIRYCDAEVAVEADTDQKVRYCNVLGAWISYLVPFSSEARELRHMFGTEETPSRVRKAG
jgi:F420-0:gamma-glutamyl ligase-like protein